MKNGGAEHFLQGLDGHPEAGIGSTRHREHLDTQVSLYSAGLTSLAHKMVGPKMDRRMTSISGLRIMTSNVSP